MADLRRIFESLLSRGRPRPRPNAFRPGLEFLENRTVPSVLYTQGFENDAWKDSIHPNSSAVAGVVTTSQGAATADGHGAFRVQLGQNQPDLLLHRRTANDASARIAGVGLDLQKFHVQKTFVVSQWVRFDPGDRIDDPGIKFEWFWGTRSTPNSPNEYNWYLKFDSDFDTFSLINNSPSGVGEPFTGYAPLRARGMSAKLSTSPGGSALLGGKSPAAFFTSGKYVQLTTSLTLNDPGKANGKFALWVSDGVHPVHVLHATDVVFRVRANDLPSKADLIGMYGGASAPQRPFGVQIDKVSLYDAVPCGQP